MISAESSVADFHVLEQFEDEFLRAVILRAAVEAGLFAALASGPGTAAGVAAAANADARSVGTVLDALVTCDLVEKRDEGLYAATPTAAAFLGPGAPSYYGRSLLEITLSLESASTMTEVIRAGSAAAVGVRPEAGTLWASDLAPALMSWSEQAQRARQMWHLAGIDPTRTPGLHCLDIACGAGVKTFALAQLDSSLTLVSLDLYPEVLELAGRVAEAMEVDSQVELRRADILNASFGREEFDVVFVSSVLYFFDEATVADIVSRIYAALRPRGRLVSDHLLADEDRCEAKEALLLAAQLLLLHPGSHVPTLGEQRTLFESAGFANIIQFGPSWLTALKPE